MSGELLHAGCVALWSSDGWRGVLIQGESGDGKSDLALRLLDSGLRLVSDDYTLVWPSEGRLYAACPPSIGGLIEARGVGILAAPTVRLVKVRLVVQCHKSGAHIERMPRDDTIELCGIAAPVLHLRPLESSAPAKLRRALSSLG
jgi:serine kinase of HPr protein (carbohydrate metabolism regulator)